MNAIAIAAALVGLYVLSRSSSAPASAGEPVQLADGSLVMPDGRIIGASGRQLATLPPTSNLRLRAATAAKSGGDAQTILKAAATTVGLASTVYSLIQKILASGSSSAAAGAAQQIIRDPAGFEQAAATVDPSSLDAALNAGDSMLNPADLSLSDAIRSDAGLTNTIVVDPSFDVWLPIDQLAPDLTVSGGELGIDFNPPPTDVPGGDVAVDIPSETGGGAGGAAGASAAAGVLDLALSASSLSPQEKAIARGAAALSVGVVQNVDDLSDIGNASDAVDAGLAVGDAGGSIPVAGVAVAVISIAMDAASNMPDDAKAAAAGLDAATVAVAFVPVVGWALAIIVGIAKSYIVSAIIGPPSHTQRELMETAKVLENARSIFAALRPACSPRQLYDTVARYGSGYTGGGAWPAIEVGYQSAAAGKVLTVGWPYRSTSLALGDPVDFVSSVANNPAGLTASIQAGVTPFRLEAANAAIATAIAKRCQLIAGALAGDASSLRILAHVWHITRDPVVNVRRWLEGTAFVPRPGVDPTLEAQLATEMPIVAEVLLSGYYDDVAAHFGFQRVDGAGGDWRQVVGYVLQPQWDAYRRRTSPATLSGFLDSLGYGDIRTLRAAVFAGKFPLPQEAKAMFELFANRLDVIEANEEALRQAYNALPYSAPSGGPIIRPGLVAPDSQGIYQLGPDVAGAVAQQGAIALANAPSGP